MSRRHSRGVSEGGQGRFPRGRFNVVYCDPPWAYRKTALVDRGRARAVEKEYRTMQPEDIAALSVASISADDAVLFMWATWPKLPEALHVMRSWGFAYKTVGFVWEKSSRHGKVFMGMGFYTRANTEVVLVGTRGRGLPRLDASVHQIVHAPIGRHSAKPEEDPARIDRLYSGSRVELFARATRRGWVTWGNDPALVRPDREPVTSGSEVLP
jgi:N6-adenosine-specific RNA methylase IME4